MLGCAGPPSGTLAAAGFTKRRGCVFNALGAPNLLTWAIIAATDPFPKLPTRLTCCLVKRSSCEPRASSRERKTCEPRGTVAEFAIPSQVARDSK